jgi:3-hydroxyisobutyrate dehydrogenase-like beta-hydroxyacid dehydrogenase
MRHGNLAEATRLAVNAGIDAKRLPEALAGGFAHCNCSCRAWRRAFILRRLAISQRC